MNIEEIIIHLGLVLLNIKCTNKIFGVKLFFMFGFIEYS
ncbi:MAG: hypothetical protein BWX77_00998 [Bacteroidetes bacterium ADurb.Bin090]|nr:MAG: hypothetical protein BWX77_00998 [Bacteroidetes bacterium ADurb.Bin090]